MLICHNVYTPRFNKMQQEANIGVSKQSKANLGTLLPLELYSLMPTTAEIVNFNGGVFSLCFKASIHAKCDCRSSDTRGKNKCNPFLQRNVEIASKKKKVCKSL